MIRKVTKTNLLKDIHECKLLNVPRDARLNELEFYFPVTFLTPQSFSDIFKENFHIDLPEEIPEQMGRLTFSPFRGFMKGFIDMVFHFMGKFYIVDWKTNFLGYERRDYNQSALMNEMAKHYYFLQAIIYTIAVNQYLRFRVPKYNYEDRFGGTLYLFLRGIDPQMGPDYGIYFLRPCADAIHKATEILIGDLAC
jgi:exodeoxyribonuclease V beta subunit